MSYKDVSRLGWNSSGVGSNFILVPGGSTMLINGNFAYSSYLIALEEALLDPRSSGINGFNLGLDFTNFNGEK